jgi:hypothetical protein
MTGTTRVYSLGRLNSSSERSDSLSCLCSSKNATCCLCDENDEKIKKTRQHRQLNEQDHQQQTKGKMNNNLQECESNWTRNKQQEINRATIRWYSGMTSTSVSTFVGKKNCEWTTTTPEHKRLIVLSEQHIGEKKAVRVEHNHTRAQEVDCSVRTTYRREEECEWTTTTPQHKRLIALSKQHIEEKKAVRVEHTTPQEVDCSVQTTHRREEKRTYTVPILDHPLLQERTKCEQTM